MLGCLQGMLGGKENLEKGWSMWRFCVSDEHYVPTLLAVLGLDSQTDCKVCYPITWGWETD